MGAVCILNVLNLVVLIMSILIFYINLLFGISLGFPYASQDTSESIELSNAKSPTKTLKILAVAGFTTAHGGRLDEVDFFNPYSETNTCKPKPKYPKMVEAHCGVGTLYCGGDAAFEGDIDNCYELVDDEWVERSPLWYKRSYSSCIELSNSSTWLFGGFGPDLIIAAETSEMKIDADSEFGWSSRLPEGMSRTCVAKINDTHLFITGNWYHHPKRAYLVDTSSDTFYFSRLPDMKEFRESAGCGSIDGEYLIVAGGFDRKIRNTTEIFSLKDNEWVDGPVMPRGFWSGGYISDENHPLILAGGDDEINYFRDDVMEYVKETNTFEFLPGKLTRPKSQLAITGVYTDEEC